MTTRKITLSHISLFILDDGSTSLCGTAPNGGSVEIKLCGLNIGQLRCAQRQIGQRLAKLVADGLAELNAVRTEAAQSWRAVNAVLAKEQPK